MWAHKIESGLLENFVSIQEVEDTEKEKKLDYLKKEMRCHQNSYPCHIKRLTLPSHEKRMHLTSNTYYIK